MPISLPDVWHIEDLKLAGYLLNVDHPSGHAKAKTFIGYGFTADEPGRLAAALYEHAGSLPHRSIQAALDTPLVFEGAMQAPLGIIPRVRSVWLLDTDGRSARLVTAYPYDER